MRRVWDGLPQRRRGPGGTVRYHAGRPAPPPV